MLTVLESNSLIILCGDKHQILYMIGDVVIMIAW